MAAVVDEGGEGISGVGGVPGAVGAPGFAVRGDGVEGFEVLHHLGLPGKPHEGIIPAGGHQGGLGLEEGPFFLRGNGAGRGDGGERVATIGPEREGEPAPVGMAGGEDVPGVGMLILQHVFEHHIVETEIAVFVGGGDGIPTVAVAVWIGQLADGGKALQIYDGGVGPKRVYLELTTNLRRCAAMTVKDKDERPAGRGLLSGVIGHADDAGAGGTIDIPLPVGYAGLRGSDERQA